MLVYEQILVIGQFGSPGVSLRIVLCIPAGMGTPDYSDHVVLDLFAGSGVGAAIKQLGASDLGVEMMPEARETRRLNGLTTIYEDVWDADKAAEYEFDTLTAGPPCPAFSVAGRGAGRKALDQVLGALNDELYTDLAELKAWSDQFEDPRIGIVLTPLHYIWRYRPQFVMLEQVPPVLPIWEAYAEKMEEMGFGVWTGVQSSEQYGVPQTRKRAYLLAKAGWETPSEPPATHSRYYPRDPQRLDPGVKKWVSMAEALDEAEKFTVISNYRTGSNNQRGERSSEQPAATITSKFTRNKKVAA